MRQHRDCTQGATVMRVVWRHCHHVATHPDSIIVRLKDDRAACDLCLHPAFSAKEDMSETRCHCCRGFLQRVSNLTEIGCRTLGEQRTSMDVRTDAQHVWRMRGRSAEDAIPGVVRKAGQEEAYPGRPWKRGGQPCCPGGSVWDHRIRGRLGGRAHSHSAGSHCFHHLGPESQCCRSASTLSYAIRQYRRHLRARRPASRRDVHSGRGGLCTPRKSRSHDAIIKGASRGRRRTKCGREVHAAPSERQGR